MLTKQKSIAMLVFYVAGFLILPVAVSLIVIVLGFSGLYMLSIVNFVTYFILCAVLLFLSRDVFKEDFKKIGPWTNFAAYMVLGLLFTFGATLIGNLTVILLGTTDIPENQYLIENILNTMPILMIVTAVIFGPIVEEIIFRLVLMNLFNWKPIYKLIFSSLIFGFLHVIAGSWIHIIPYTLIGLVFGYFYLKFQNIWHITILHILHNAITVGLTLQVQQMMENYI